MILADWSISMNQFAGRSLDRMLRSLQARQVFGPWSRVSLWLVAASFMACGLGSLLVSAAIVEGDDAFHVVWGPHRIRLPDSGMLGDQGTYIAEWGLLGLALMGASILCVILSFTTDVGSRWLFAMMLAFAMMFTCGITTLLFGISWM